MSVAPSAPEHELSPCSDLPGAATGEKTCIDCHKAIAHHLPDMRGIPGWQ